MDELAEFERNLRATAFMDNTLAALEQGDLEYIGVFPVIEGGYHFCYSVGRQRRGLPELIVTGVSQSGGPFLEYVDSVWDTWPGYGLWTPEGSGNLATIPVPVPISQEHNTLAWRMATEPFETIQVVWEDDEGLWPWDKNDPTLPILNQEWVPFQNA